MAFVKAHLSDDCKFLTVTGTGVSGDASLIISNNDTVISQGVSFNLSMVNDDAYLNTVTYPLADLGDVDWGIITVRLMDSAGNVALGGCLSSCSLDCCLAKYVEELTKCSCKDDACNKTFQSSQKIFLFIKSIHTLLSNIGSDLNIAAGKLSQAIEMHTSAKLLCEDDCGCDC